MSHLISKISKKIQHSLSHRPVLYALIVGASIVLFWRGVWHSADYIHALISDLYLGSSTSVLSISWWDGPLSLVTGSIILYITGAFTSSFIGNELILSGLRGERRLSEKTEADLKEEVVAIADIKDELSIISKKLEMLQKKADNNHKHL